MSDLIADLLIRNLLGVFGEPDPVRRRAAIAAVFHEDAIFVDHHGTATGHAALDRRVAELHERMPGWAFQPASAPQTLEGAGRLAWRFGPRGEAPRVTGLDVIQVRDGRIAALYAFLDAPAG